MTEKKMSNKEKMKKLNKRINNNPDDAEAYFERAIFFQTDDMKKIADLKQAIKIDPNLLFAISHIAKFNEKKNRFDKAIKYHKRILKSDLKDPLAMATKEASLLHLLEICIKQNKLKKLINLVDREIELNIDNLDEINDDELLMLIVKEYAKKINHILKFEILHRVIRSYMEMGKYQKAADFYQSTIGDIHYDKNDFDVNLENIDIETISKLAQELAHQKKLNEAYKILNQLYLLPFTELSFRDNLKKEYDKINKISNEQDVNKAKEEERNKIIADLSHSIKNMLGTVIDPLENLKDEKEVRPNIINNAIRGANLIRQIVNAMNLSFKGSYDDFVYDAQHSKGSDAVSLETMIIESLKHSLSNMFDSKYFGNFMRNYFPQKEIYQEAKSTWKRISDSEEVEDIETFTNKYFFKTEFDLDSAYDFIIGNEKGSAIKLQILFQEIIFNAVKYTGFIDKKNRVLKIKFSHSNDKISFIVKNSYKPSEKTKTTGLGHVVIENFAKLLRTKPAIERTEAKYSLKLKFNNFWK